MKENKKIIIIILSVIIILISTISVYFIAKDKPEKEVEKVDSNVSEETNENTGDDSEIVDEELENEDLEDDELDNGELDDEDFGNEELDDEPLYDLATSNDVEYLESMIPLYLRGEGYNIYQGKLVTVTEIPAEKLGINVYFELDNHDDAIIASLGEFKGEPNYDDYADETKYYAAYEKKCKEAGHLYYSEMCYVKNNKEEKGLGFDAYKEELVKKIYKRFYGENYNYKASSYIGLSAGGCNYQSGYYFCGEGGGYTSEGEFNYTKVLKNEEKNNQMYIYEQYLYVETKCDKNLENCVDTIYTNVDKKNKIASEKNDEYNLFEKYGSKAIIYKHTFKKNSDGTYYWYSVEPVK